MSIPYGLLRAYLRQRAHGDAEAMHTLGLRYATEVQRSPQLLALLEWWYRAQHNPTPRRVAGIYFPNPIGFAAGLDKNGVMPVLLQALGFGFGEIGTVLPNKQDGNARPRFFEVPSGFINRFGFNSVGCARVQRALQELAPRIRIPLGGSLGVMKGTAETLSPTAAANDCATAASMLWDNVQFLIANVSSPNTPGLRTLLQKQYIRVFVSELSTALDMKAERTGTARRPLFVKVSADLSEHELVTVLEAAVECGAQGLVIGNTTTTRPLMLISEHRDEQGGLSGSHLYPLMLQLLCWARRVDRSFPIVAAGGINPYNVQEVFDAGAGI